MFKILILEDDKELNKTVCSFLNHSGYEAVGCLNANDAYDALYENIFDLIVSDIMMPHIDGFEFARNVRELNEDIPILFMTARDDIASKQRGFRIGVDDYMVKPIDLDELFLRIGAQLRRLDSNVTKKATTVSLIFGVIGALVMGAGMSLAMTDVGKIIGLLDSVAMLVGVLIGIVGILLVCLAYPIYNYIVKREREKIAPEIIRIADELLK